MKLIFATNNPHKSEEAQEILGPAFTVVIPASLGFPGDLPETHETLRGNSIQKACAVWNLFQSSCFADDTGLEVDALNGAPGVYTARYAGSDKDPAANRRRLLKELEGLPFEKRTARFRCVVSFSALPNVFTIRISGGASPSTLNCVPQATLFSALLVQYGLS